MQIDRWFKVHFFTFLFLLNLLILYFMRTLNPTTLIFEQIWFSGFLTFLFYCVFLRKRSNSISLGNTILITILICFSLVHVFVNIDRSRSFYVLSWIKYEIVTYNNAELTINKNVSDELTNIEGIELRIKEAIERGLVSTNKKQEMKLTLTGKILLELSEDLSSIFRLTQWEKETR